MGRILHGTHVALACFPCERSRHLGYDRAAGRRIFNMLISTLAGAGARQTVLCVQDHNEVPLWDACACHSVSNQARIAVVSKFGIEEPVKPESMSFELIFTDIEEYLAKSSDIDALVLFGDDVHTEVTSPLRLTQIYPGPVLVPCPVSWNLRKHVRGIDPADAAVMEFYSCYIGVVRALFKLKQLTTA